MMVAPARATAVSLFGLDGGRYQPHAVHHSGRTYIESNCYTDVIIELLHARGDEPLAALGCLVRTDFEGDQWTFFKPPPDDLEALYGIDIHEMQPYRPLPLQIAEQIEAGRTLLVELDAWHLPDTAATSYRREHVKTSVAVASIDLDRRWLRYFHGPGLFELEGDDYAGVFHLGGTPDPRILPPYTELVRFDSGPRLAGEALRAAARERLRHHLAHRPASDPFARFGAQLEQQLPSLLEGGADAYHAYAFATVRMVGAAFELAASAADWTLGADAAPATAAMTRIVDGCKVLGFRLARLRPFDPQPLIESLSAAWSEAIAGLETVASPTDGV
jgi:hypothetical protein